jgi:hypothetical protein
MVRMVPCCKPLLLYSLSQLLCSPSLEIQIGIESRRSDVSVTYNGVWDVGGVGVGRSGVLPAQLVLSVVESWQVGHGVGIQAV